MDPEIQGRLANVQFYVTREICGMWDAVKIVHKFRNTVQIPIPKLYDKFMNTVF